MARVVHSRRTGLNTKEKNEKEASKDQNLTKEYRASGAGSGRRGESSCVGNLARPAIKKLGLVLLSHKARMYSIKILLVIEVRLIANMFESVLGDEPDMNVVGFVSSLKSALAFLQSQKVDVALISAGLPDQEALKLTGAIMEEHPSTKVLALGLAEENDQDTLRYIEAGAAGYILKNSSLKELIEVIRLAQKGEAQVSTRMAGAMMERLFRLAHMFSAVETKIDGDVRLTSRELEVLHFIREGLTNQEIAARLVVEVGTVKNHVHRILEKLNVSSRQEAAAYLGFLKR